MLVSRPRVGHIEMIGHVSRPVYNVRTQDVVPINSRGADTFGRVPAGRPGGRRVSAGSGVLLVDASLTVD